jgi:hypothetical protein
MCMWRCKLPRRSVSRPGALFCSMVYNPGYLKDAVWAVCTVRGLHPLHHYRCTQRSLGWNMWMIQEAQGLQSSFGLARHWSCSV